MTSNGGPNLDGDGRQSTSSVRRGARAQMAVDAAGKRATASSVDAADAADGMKARMVHRGTAPFIATVVVVFAYCGLHVADVFQNVRRLRATVPGFPVFARLWPSVPIALAMVGVRLFMVRTLRPLGRAALPATKWEPEVVQRHASSPCPADTLTPR